MNTEGRNFDMSNIPDITRGDVRILDAVASDAEGIANVQNDTWLTTYPSEEAGIAASDIPPWKNNSPEQVARWQREIEDQSGTQHVWAVKDGEKVIGYCKAIKSEVNNEVESIYILQTYQGQGIGKKLIMQAMEWIGLDKDIILKVATHNEPTIRFYEGIGFERTDRPTKQINYPSGQHITLMEMVRKHRE